MQNIMHGFVRMLHFAARTAAIQTALLLLSRRLTPVSDE